MKVDKYLQILKNRRKNDWDNQVEANSPTIDDMTDIINRIQPTKALGFKRVLGGVISV